MVSLCIPPIASGDNLGADGAILPPFLLYLLRDLLRDAFLFFVVKEDSASVLRADIRALPVGCRRIMHLVEEFKKLSVRDFFWVEHDLKRLSIYDDGLVQYSQKRHQSALCGLEILTSGCPTANSSVARVLRIASNISDSCVQETFTRKCFPIHVLYAPETARRHSRKLGAGGQISGGSLGTEAHWAAGEWAHQAREY
jgi:hypothetical protein